MVKQCRRADLRSPPGAALERDNELELDAVFSALAHPTRRAVLDRLGEGPTTVSALAEPHGLSLPGFMKHVRVLESARLIACEKGGRSVTCALTARPTGGALEWLAQRERLWHDRLDALGRHLHHRAEVGGGTPTRSDR